MVLLLPVVSTVAQLQVTLTRAPENVYTINTSPAISYPTNNLKSKLPTFTMCTPKGTRSWLIYIDYTVHYVDDNARFGTEP